LRRKFGPKREEVEGSSKNFNHEEFMNIIPHSTYNYDDETKEGEMGGSCGTYD
jgi:hypothetical protein